jgi:hypothetical protein
MGRANGAGARAVPVLQTANARVGMAQHSALGLRQPVCRLLELAALGLALLANRHPRAHPPSNPSPPDSYPRPPLKGVRILKQPHQKVAVQGIGPKKVPDPFVGQRKLFIHRCCLYDQRIIHEDRVDEGATPDSIAFGFHQFENLGLHPHRTDHEGFDAEDRRAIAVEVE